MKHITSPLLYLAFVAACLFGSPAVAQTTPADHLDNKTLLVFGDSYVKNHREPFENTWHYKVAQRHNMRYINYGRNGSSIAFDRTRDGFGPSMLTRLSEIQMSADYVIVIAGHNDAGLIKDSADSLAIFRDAMENLCARLIDKFPQARIAFVTPWNVNRTGFHKVINTIVEVCGEWSIPVLRADLESGIHVRSEDFRQRYFQNGDTAHLNNDGHNLILNWADKFITGL